jgi:endonuclease/exonuclease/phosphatase family metal-dependent hydrolase
MLETFPRVHDLDLVLLQEVTHQFNTPFPGYDIHYNIGSARRGTAFLLRNTLMATNLSRIPSGRAMAISAGGIHVVNIYAHSGTSKRLEREIFFNNDLPYLLDMASEDILLGGDFNCVLDAGDSTGHESYSRSLNTLIHGYSLRDAWQARPGNTAYTDYTALGTTRLDRVYLTEGLLRRKTGVATVAAAFTDHLAVILLSMGAPLLRRIRGTWKLRSHTLTSTHAMEDLQHQWPQWRKQLHLYPNINLWLSHHCKKRLRQIFQRVEAERRLELQTLENVYCDCIYALVRTADINPSAIPALHHLNAKIVRLHAKRLQSSMTDTAPADNIPGATPNLYQLLRKHKRRSARLVRSDRDETGTIQTSVTGIASVFTSFIQHKYRRTAWTTSVLLPLLT